MSDQLILVLNCGSSSLKGAVIDRKNGSVVLSCLGERLGTPEAVITFSKDGNKRQAPLSGRNCHAGAVGMLLNELEKHGLHDRIKAIGHRIAHGGEKYHESVLIDQDVLDELKACIPLAPLHNPANISGILAAQEHFPGLPNVGVMDTSFHQTMPERAYTYAVPRELRKKYAFRRYGFHGTSMRYVAPEAARILGKPLEDLRMIVAHLGNGASITAIRNGKSVDTSMGFTPIEGLVMGTRCGDIDPGVYSYLTAHAGMNIEQVDEMLNKKSGLPPRQIHRLDVGRLRRHIRSRLHRRHRRKLPQHPRQNRRLPRLFGSAHRHQSQYGKTLRQLRHHQPDRFQPRRFGRADQRRTDDRTRHRRTGRLFARSRLGVRAERF